MSRQNKEEGSARRKKHREKNKPVVVSRSILLPATAIGLVIKLYDTPHPTLMRALYLVGCALILEEIYMSVIKRYIKVTVAPLVGEICKGREVELKLTIQNTSFLPLPYTYIFLKESYYLVPKKTQCLCITLPRRSERTYKIKYEAKYSGVDKIGIKELVLMDYFEVSKRKIRKSYLQDITILPQLTVPNELKMDMTLIENQKEPLEVALQHTKNQGEVSYELASYQEGESERLIHWKLVAQRDIYMVRERETLMKLKQQCLVVIDPLVGRKAQKIVVWKKLFPTLKVRARWEMEEKKAQEMDAIITSCMSYLYSLLNQEKTIKLVCYKEGEWIEIDAHRKNELEYIAKILCKESFKNEIDHQKRYPKIRVGNYSDKVLLTAHMDSELEELIEENPDFQIVDIGSNESDEEPIAQQKADRKKKGRRYLGRQTKRTPYSHHVKDYKVIHEEGR